MTLVTAADLAKSGDYDAAAFELPVACDLSVFPRQLWRQRNVVSHRPFLVDRVRRPRGSKPECGIESKRRTNQLLTPQRSPPPTKYRREDRCCSRSALGGERGGWAERLPGNHPRG